MNTTLLSARYLDVVRNRLGLDAHLDDDGDVVICNGHLTFVASLFGDNDPEYADLVLPIGPPPTPVPSPMLHTLANATNRCQKGATVIVQDDDSIIITAKLLLAGTDCLPSADHLAAVLPRAMRMLVAAAQRFVTDLAVHGMESTFND